MFRSAILKQNFREDLKDTVRKETYFPDLEKGLKRKLFFPSQQIYINDYSFNMKYSGHNK